MRNSSQSHCDQIDQAPAHHAVDGRDRALSTTGAQGRRCASVSRGGLARRLAVDQALGPLGVERSTQSRTICSVTPPIRAASVREPPS